ncbi:MULTISPECIES: hypothetical protein [Clostridium]|uniref:hypothetical protein n=1 Tax=Clostridium TaxID=1485 RepID=UPI00069ED8CD|nr:MULTISPECIES: hypothetical protein [Clostridium]KOF57852.1 hypothetical protein AGR56_16750 [Clostridium sp. DMHC 10]MCD2345081.1 hypothetical protein [Clostridium guangxiense]
MAYEAREAELHDKNTMIKSGVIKVAENLLKMEMRIELVAKTTELSEEEIQNLKEKNELVFKQPLINLSGCFFVYNLL